MKEDFNEWIKQIKTKKNKMTTFNLLMSKFNELRGEIQLDDIEKEFKYSKDTMGLSRRREYNNMEEEFSTSKEIQAVNTFQLIQNLPPNDVLVFTDGSSFGNPGPTGAGVAAFLDGYDSSPVLLHKGISKNSNNFTGELAAIELASEAPLSFS